MIEMRIGRLYVLRCGAVVHCKPDPDGQQAGIAFVEAVRGPDNLPARDAPYVFRKGYVYRYRTNGTLRSLSAEHNPSYYANVVREIEP